MISKWPSLLGLQSASYQTWFTCVFVIYVCFCTIWGILQKSNICMYIPGFWYNSLGNWSDENFENLGPTSCTTNYDSILQLHFWTKSNQVLFKRTWIKFKLLKSVMAFDIGKFWYFKPWNLFHLDLQSDNIRIIHYKFVSARHYFCNPLFNHQFLHSLIASSCTKM